MTNQAAQNTPEGVFGNVKEISVIFATIGGFEVPSTASMDEVEDVAQRKEELNNVLGKTIRQYGGFIDKIIRGFFMATFGTLIPHEDHSARAVLAAMKMIEALEDFQGALLFRTAPAYQTALDCQNISDELRGEFEAHGTPLSGNVTVSIKAKGSRWLILDWGADQTFVLNRSENRLNVHRGAKAHLGVNSGTAWVGELTAGDYSQQTVIGDTVNLSARLKGKAGLNQIVVSPATYELTKDLFTYDSLDPVELKGITEPVPIFAVTGLTPEVERQVVISDSDNGYLESISLRDQMERIPPHLRGKINAARRAIRGERKLVTMLYSDLSGFTALSEKFRDEPWKIAILINECHDKLGEVVYKAEGIVEQIVGDELMALFGAPITHEDDPERAIEVGLKMLEAIKQFSDEKATAMGMPPLNVHIGINTGRIAIGDISTDDAMKMDYTAIGEPVELAELLEDISDAGELLVGDRTYRLTHALFDYEKKTMVEVGGKPVPVYKVLGKKAVPGIKRGIDILNDVFVARNQEFGALRAAVDLLFENAGHFVCTIGLAGLGKSRLKRELKTELGERVSWLEGACFGQTERIAYSIFIDAIKDYLDIQETDRDEVVKAKLIFKVENLFRDSDEDLSEEIIPYIGNQLLSLYFEGERADKVRYLDAEGRRQRTFAAIRHLLVAESKRRPVVFALEDLHWVDAVSLDLIFYLMETAIDSPILLLCLYRPEREDRCWEIGERAKVRIPQNFTEVSLKPLSPQESQQLLDGLLTLEGADALKAQILEKADGNPFYMEEILRALIDDEVIERENSHWVVQRDVEEIDVPDTLEQMMGARIDKLPDEPKEVLQNGAVIGRTFEYDILQGVSDDISNLETHLSRLNTMDMVEPRMPATDPLEYIFGHIITHEIAYSAIPSMRRRRLHTQVGDCIVHKHQTHLERVYELLAQYYRDGNDAKKAVIYLAKAGTKAKQQFNNKDAQLFYQQGLERLEQLTEALPEEWMLIHEGLGDVYRVVATSHEEFEEAIRHYTETLQNASAPVHRAALKRKMAYVYEKRSEFDVAMVTLTDALEELKSQQDAVEEAHIYNDIGWIYSKKGDFEGAIKTTAQALKLVEDTTAYDVMTAIDKNLGSYYQRTGDVKRGKAYYNRAIERAERIGDLMLMAQVYLNLGALEADTTGRIDLVLESYQKSLQLFEQLGDTVGAMKNYYNIGVIYSRTGEFSRALEYFSRARAVAQLASSRLVAAYAHLGMAGAHWRQKDYEQASTHYLEGLKIFEEINQPTEIAMCNINLAELALKLNNLQAAEKYASTGFEIAQQINLPKVIAGAYKNLGLVEKYKTHWSRAIEYCQQAAKIAKEADAKPELAGAYRHLGELYLEGENSKRAREFLKESLNLFEELQDRSEIEQIQALLEECNAQHREEI